MKDVTIHSKVTLFYNIFRNLVSFSYKFRKSGFKNWNQEKNLSILMVHTYMKSVSVWRLCRMSINLIGRRHKGYSTLMSVGTRPTHFLKNLEMIGRYKANRPTEKVIGRKTTDIFSNNFAHLWSEYTDVGFKRELTQDHLPSTQINQ